MKEVHTGDEALHIILCEGKAEKVARIILECLSLFSMFLILPRGKSESRKIIRVTLHLS